MASSSPSQSYSRRELYGGTITVELPSDFIDASTLRQIPDHQEVHLSPRTLTSLIFEINTYQSESEIQSQTTPEMQALFSNISSYSSSSSSSSSPQEKQDMKASMYHFLDPILPPDEIDMSSQSQSQPQPSSNIISPKKTKLESRSLNSFPAYLSSGTVISAEIDKDASSALPREWAQNPTMKRSQVRVYQLLVRMERYETDFCVRANVPLKEFVGDKGKEDEELKMVEEIMSKIVSTMDIVEFGLFGEEE